MIAKVSINLFYVYFQRLEREKAERGGSLEKVVEELTPEQKLAEKLRAQKLQEESDLRLAMETFGEWLYYLLWPERSGRDGNITLLLRAEQKGVSNSY